MSLLLILAICCLCLNLQKILPLVYIDCNAYSPAINSMESFLPHIVPGGFIVIDEKLQGSESEAILDFAEMYSLKVKRLGSNHTPMCIEIPTSSKEDIIFTDEKL